MAQHATPEELLARVAKRDTNALVELYDRSASRLYRILLRILASPRDAEAVLEDVFLQLWNGARRLQHDPVSVAAWLAVTARSTGIHRLRAKRALTPLRQERPIPLEKSASCLPSPEEIALLEERHDLLKKVATQLPAAQLQLLELLVFEGYTEKEIAHRLGEPLGKVKTGLRASMTFLRQRLRAILGTWAANI